MCSINAAAKDIQVWNTFRFLANLSISPADTSLINSQIATAGAFLTTNSDTAIRLLEDAVSDSKHLGFQEGVVRGKLMLGSLYLNLGEYDKSRNTFREALDWSDQAEPRKAKYLASAFNGIGRTYQSQSNFREAGLNYIRSAEEAAKDTSLKVFRAYVYNNLGGVLIRLNEHQKALQYFRIAEQLARSAQDRRALANVLGNKGIYYEELNQFDSSEQCYKEALTLSQLHKDEALRLTTLSNLGALYMKQELYERAVTHFEEVLKSAGGNNPYILINGPLYFLGAANYSLGRYDKAKKYLLLSLHEAEKIHQETMNPELYELLSKVYAATGDFQNAYSYRLRFAALRDSLMGQEAKARVNELETQYRTAQKDKKLIETQLKLSMQELSIQQKNKWISIYASCTVLLFAILGWLYRSYRHKQKLHSIRLRTLQQEKEIELLQAMMQGEEKERLRLAHELHNGISSQFSAMRAYMSAVGNKHPHLRDQDDFRQVVGMLDETAADVRKAAHNLLPEGLIRQGLVVAVDTFCKQMCMDRDLQIEYQAYGDFGDLPGDFALAIYRMVQELLHNVLRHADATNAIIILHKSRSKLEVTVEDNGKGGAAHDFVDTGIGLKALREKVELLNGSFSVESLLGKGTVVYAALPLETETKFTADENTGSHHG